MASAPAVKSVFDNGIDQRLLGGKGPKDGPFRDTSRLGNLPSAHIATEAFQQRLGCRDERGAAFIKGQGGSTGHRARIMSEHSLNKRFWQEGRRLRNVGTIGGPLEVGHTERYGGPVRFADCRSSRLDLKSGIWEEQALGLGRLADEVFEAVIFDMDGTLIDSTPAVARSWATWASEYGLPPLDLHAHHGTPSESVVRAVMPAHLHEAGMQRITELEISDVHDVVVLPGAVEALASLASSKNAIATSCTVPLAEARIAAAELVPPSVLVTADDVAHGKPHPQPFLEAARRLGADPQRCLVVEDAPKGLEAARAAGCFTLAVVTTTPREALDADAIVTDLSKVRFEVDEDGVRVRLVEQFDDALRVAQLG